MKDNRSGRRGYRVEIALGSYTLAGGTHSLRGSHRARRVPNRHAPSPRAPAIVAADAGTAPTEAHAHRFADSNPPFQGGRGSGQSRRNPFHDINHENSSSPVLGAVCKPSGAFWRGLASMERSIKASQTLFHDALYCASFFGRIHPVNHSELLQQLPVAVVETDDSGELRAISPFMLTHLTPNLDPAQQQTRARCRHRILRP